MRTALALLSIALVCVAVIPASAQEATSESTPGDRPDAETAAPEASEDSAPNEAGREDGEPASAEAAPNRAEPHAGERASAATSEGSERTPPKVAVVVAGDPDPALRDAARRVERASGEQLRLPFDPGLRGAMRGDPSEGEDGLEGVRRERRQLGGDEARDAPVLAALGRRAGADVVAVVRAGERGPELVVLDVRNAAFFEGTLALSDETDDARIARFVRSRARASARGAEQPPAGTPAPEAATEESPQPARQPDFFEQFWPYFVAGGLLAALLIGIAVTSATAGSNEPVLRFVPGGP